MMLQAQLAAVFLFTCLNLLPRYAQATCVASSATCYHDSRAGRVLPYPNSHPTLPDGGAHLTRAGCMQLCDTAGYTIAGVEDGHQCFCGHSVPTWAKKAADTFCSMPCKGDAEESCGGNNGGKLSEFHRSKHHRMTSFSIG